MRRYLVNTLSITAAGSAIAVAAFLGAASAQDTLPPGPGMEQTMKACGDCHGIGQIIGLQRTAAEWSDTLVAMINVGAPVAEADFDIIVNYLATHFGPAGAAPAPGAVPAVEAATGTAPAAEVPAAPATAPAAEAATGTAPATGAVPATGTAPAAEAPVAPATAPAQ